MKKTKPINHSKLLKEAKKTAILSESIIDMLVDLIFGPYLHIKGRELKNSKEWKDTEAQIKLLTAKSEKLRKKSQAYIKQLEKDLRQNAINIREKKPIKPL